VNPTPGTLAAYAARGIALLARCARETGVPQPGPMTFAEWLVDQRPVLKPATWRLYRASAVHLLEGNPDTETRRALELVATPLPSPGQLPARTSALKQKKVGSDDLKDLVLALRRVGTDLSALTEDWLVAGLMTGLRPCEWGDANIGPEIVNIGAGPVLVVRNRKATQGRGLGEFRPLELAGFHPEDVARIRRMADRGREWTAAGVYATRQKSAADCLARTARALWPRRTRYPTLYSARHQFSAHAKSVHSQEGVSALLGHAVAETAVSHYGRRSSAWGKSRPVVPSPSPAAVASVRSRTRSRPSDHTKVPSFTG
jgi:hypothetical protein